MRTGGNGALAWHSMGSAPEKNFWDTPAAIAAVL